MKTLFTRALLSATLMIAVSSTNLFAATAKAVSSTTDTGQWNGASGQNVNPVPAANWSSASTVDSSAEWISFTPVGGGVTGNQGNGAFVNTANGTVVTFFQNVYVPAGATITGVSISAMSADTVQIDVNGHTVQAYDTTTDSYYGCGATNGCRFTGLVTPTVSTAYVSTGVNVFKFSVKKLSQVEGSGIKSGFGLVYVVTVTYTPAC